MSPYVVVTVLCSSMGPFSTRLTLTIPSRIPTILSSIARKLLRTSRGITNNAFPNSKRAPALVLMPPARKPTIPASTKLRAQFKLALTLTSTISVLHRRTRFLPRPTFPTFRTLQYSLRSVPSTYTKRAPMHRLTSLEPLVTVSYPRLCQLTL
jgi:hypothetical protein